MITPDNDTPTGNRLIIVSNRLPVLLEKDDQEQWHVTPGSGGLVTAMAPVLRNRGGLWIGWPGVVEEDNVPVDEFLARASKDAGYALEPVILVEKEKDDFYQGFSNEIIWPLFHDLQTRCRFIPEYFQAYRAVNSKFAAAIFKNLNTDDYVWVHDYHLMGVAQELRNLRVKSKIGFFLHIPFPPLDIFLKLPWRFEILNELLEYDLLGFQTMRDKRNFIQCVRTLVKGVYAQSKGAVHAIGKGDHEVVVGAFPISIDFNEFAEKSKSDDVAQTAWYIHEDLPDRQLILGIDRLDYTKGIPERLEAFRTALGKYPELLGKISLIQVVIPSRINIPKYQSLKTEIEQLVSDINGQYTRSGWVPIHYIFRQLDRRELLAYYRTSEIALVTPLKDGMNLVAKEFCASSLDLDSVLILSEFAGATAQLQKWALLVNPYDIEGVARAIHTAFHMPGEERRTRMRYLRHAIRRQDIFWWVDSFLKAAISKDLNEFPVLREYFPEDNLP